MPTSNPLALQLYTLRDLAKNDFAGTIRLAGKAGYEAVETAGHGGMTAFDLRKLLDDNGLTLAGSHVSSKDLQEAFDKTADFLHELKSPYAIVGSPPPETRGSVDGWKKFAHDMSDAGRRLKSRGIGLAYHNHAMEFDPIGDTTGYDIFFSEADPAAVKAEIDTFWVYFAGGDPVERIRKMNGRCSHIHLKDVSRETKEKDSEIGEGLLDWPAIMQAARESGAEWYVVEQEHYTRSLEDSIRLSLENMRRMGLMP